MPGSAFIDVGGDYPLRSHWDRLVPEGWVWRPPLMEHGPEVDDRRCLKHGWYRWNFFFGKLPCGECQQEEFQAWRDEVQGKFQHGLEAAARGERVTW